MSKFHALLVAVALMLVATSTQAAPIVFDDFNVNEGHFNLAPNFSGTTVGEDSTSTADRVTTDSPIEGAGHQKLVLVHDTTTTPFRIRHLSGGGAPAGASGGPANTAFTTTAGTDGFIGYYLRTNATGWQTSLNLDGPGNTAAEMDGSSSLPVIGDGLWHLYEWDLDSTTLWTSVPGVGGGHGGSLVNGQHFIDSIYLRDLDGAPGPTAEFFFDFVALNDAGSVAALVPEPATLGLLAMAFPAMLRRRRA